MSDKQEENLELKIRMPPDLLAVQSKSSSANHNRAQSSSQLQESECKIYLIITLSVALTFCVLSATIVIVACFKKYQESKAIFLAQKLEKEEQEQMARTEVKSVMQNKAAANYAAKAAFEMPTCSGQPHQYQSPHVFTGSSSSRPVTVRSVKRRDKAKIEERRSNNQQGQTSKPLRSLAADTNAVMI